MLMVSLGLWLDLVVRKITQLITFKAPNVIHSTLMIIYRGDDSIVL